MRKKQQRQNDAITQKAILGLCDISYKIFLTLIHHQDL
jgi:hypothetical protein